MKIRKSIKKSVAVLISFVILLTGCNTNSNKKEPEIIKNGIDISKKVDLIMYLIGTKPNDMDRVLEEFNKLAEEELNCTLRIEWIGWGDFSNEYPILLSSGEQVDLIYAANWLNFYSNAQRGAFLPLDELLEKYAPESYAQLSKEEIEDVSIDNHIYAIPANYTNYSAFGPIIRKDYLKKYKVKEINTFDDYINFCKHIGKSESMDPTGLYASGIELDDMYLMSKGYYPLNGSTGSLYWIDLNDENHTVYFISECPAMEYFLKNAKGWFESGCWASSVLASKDETRLEEGKAVSRVHNYDAWLGEAGKNNAFELEYFNLANPLYEQPANQDAMAIPVASKYPERALMLLEKLKNDERYYMLLTYGIEGYNYVINKDGRIEFLNETYGNEPGTWGFRDEKFRKTNAATTEEALERRNEYASVAQKNPLPGFYLELKNIEKEYTNIDYVRKLYYDPLILGYIDYKTGLKELNENLAIEGNEKVKEEIQRQIDKVFNH